MRRRGIDAGGHEQADPRRLGLGVGRVGRLARGGAGGGEGGWPSEFRRWRSRASFRSAPIPRWKASAAAMALWLAAGWVPISSNLRMSPSCPGLGGHQRPDRADPGLAGRRASPCRPAPGATCGGWPRSSRRRGRRGENGNWAKAWAPSTKVAAPRSRAIAAIARTGRTAPVRLTTCVTSTTLVRGVMAWRNAATMAAGERRGGRERDPPDDDPVAAGALVPGGHHPAVVLVRRQHLVAPLGGRSPRSSVCIPSEAFRVMAISSGSQPNSRASSRRTAFDPGFEQVPQVMRRGGVGEPEVAGQGVHDDRGRGADAAVVEVDQGSGRRRRPGGSRPSSPRRPATSAAGRRPGDRPGLPQPRERISPGTWPPTPRPPRKRSTIRHRVSPRIAHLGRIHTKQGAIIADRGAPVQRQVSA